MLEVQSNTAFKLKRTRGHFDTGERHRMSVNQIRQNTNDSYEALPTAVAKICKKLKFLRCRLMDIYE